MKRNSPKIPRELTAKDRRHMSALGLEDNPREYLRRRRNSDILYNFLGTAAVIGIGLATIKGAFAGDQNTLSKWERVEQKALGEVKTAENSVVVLREGATYRTVPKIVNPSTGDSVSTVAGEVKKGQVLRIDRPFVYHDEEGATWLGFNNPKEANAASTAQPEEIYWVNFSSLTSQNSNGKVFVDLYDYPKIAPTGPYELQVSLTSDGLLRSGNSTESVGLASWMPETSFDHSVQHEGLSLSHGK